MFLFIALPFAAHVSAANYYFVGINPANTNKADELNNIKNWYDSTSSQYLTTGTALDTLHNWYIAKSCSTNTNITARGDVYLNSGITLSVQSSKDLIITGTFYLYGTLQLIGNSQSILNIYATGQLINYNVLNVNAGTLSIYGNLTNTATATIAGGASMTLQPGGTLTNTGTITNNGTLTISSGSTFTNTGTLAGTAPTGAGITTLSVTANTSVTAGAVYSGITVTNGAVLTAQGDLTTTTLTLTSGSLALNGTLNVSSTISGSSSSNVITSNGSSSLNFTGTSSGTIYTDQTSVGTSNTFTDITLNTSGTITLGNATQVSGVLTPTGGTLVSGGNLTLASTAAGSYGQIAVGNGTISGNVIMEMTASNTDAGWRPVGLPLTATLANLSGINKVYSGHTPSNEINVYCWDATQDGSTGNNIGWMACPSTNDETKAYLIYANNNSGGLHDFTGKFSLTGTYTTGSHAFSIYNYQDPGFTSGTPSDAQGWNFIPNPYPSNISVTSLIDAGNTNFTPSYKAIHVYNYIAGQYQVYSNSGVSIINYNNVAAGNSITNIPPYAGFWVKSNADQTMTITDDERTTSMTNVATLHKKSLDLLRLNVFDANKGWDQCVVYFMDGATTGFDESGDAYKKDGMGNAPSLSTLIGETRTAINAFPTNLDKVSVPVSFRSTVQGTTTFSPNFDEIGSEWNIFLEDKFTGKMIDLRNGDYSFENNGSSDLRFVLHLEKKGATAVFIPETNNFRLFQDYNNVQIDAGSLENPIQVTVYSINGQLVETLEVSNRGIQTLALHSLQQSGIYIVEATDGITKTTIKVVR